MKKISNFYEIYMKEQCILQQCRSSTKPKFYHYNQETLEISKETRMIYDTTPNTTSNY